MQCTANTSACRSLTHKSSFTVSVPSIVVHEQCICTRAGISQSVSPPVRSNASTRRAPCGQHPARPATSGAGATAGHQPVTATPAVRWCCCPNLLATVSCARDDVEAAATLRQRRRRRMQQPQAQPVCCLQRCRRPRLVAPLRRAPASAAARLPTPCCCSPAAVAQASCGADARSSALLPGSLRAASERQRAAIRPRTPA